MSPAAAAGATAGQREPGQRDSGQHEPGQHEPGQREPGQRDSGQPGRPSLAARVEEQLRRLIARGEFPRGCRLPTEFALCRRFGVSRPVVRAALAGLREAGDVSSTRGSGHVVLRGPEPGAQAFPLIRTLSDIDAYFEFRAAVEAEAARLAALRHTRATLAAIEAALDEGEALARLGATELSGDVNFRFHRAIGAATGNGFHLATLEALPNLIGLGPVEVRVSGQADPRARLRAILDEHATIFAAIAARDAVRAAAEMAAHITSARRFVFARQPVTGQPVTGQPFTGQPFTGQPAAFATTDDREKPGAREEFQP